MIDDLQTLILQRKNQTLDLYYHLGIPINGCTQKGWFISWNILLKWMISRGTPILGNHHILIILLKVERYAAGKVNLLQRKDLTPRTTHVSWFMFTHLYI